MEHTLVYRAWQAPFAERKFAPVREHNDLRRVRRVLDVGCGPATNTHHFADADYLGIDINPRYVAAARQRTGREFIAADATTYQVEPSQRFEFIFLNSFLHHVDTESVRRLLRNISTLLSTDGFVHILDLILPDNPSVARTLARWDRGEHARPAALWHELFADAFVPDLELQYALSVGSIPLWHMIYFRGRRRDA
jgi:SAM-dependent methyltransferase